MTPSPEPQEGSAAIAEDLRTVVARLVRRLRAGYAVAPHQFSVLSTIERTGPQTASQLATAEIVRPQSMAHTLQQLTEAGFVTRRPDPADGRQTLVALSDAGRLAIEEQRRETTGWLAAAIDHELDAEERRALATAVTLLGRLVER
ncbi:MarR family transcriptional regulator [Nocardioides korecus]